MTTDLQDKKALEEAIALARDNNRMLKKLRRGQLWGRAWSIFYWVVIIGAALGAFFFLQPFIDQFKDISSGFGENIGTVQELLGNDGAEGQNTQPATGGEQE